MDFVKIQDHIEKNGTITVQPEFIVARSKDLMVRGGTFYAIWDDQNHTWSTNEYDVARLVDVEIWKKAEEIKNASSANVVPKLMTNYSSGSWAIYKTYVSKLSDNYIQLDTALHFEDEELKRADYASKKLPYSLKQGSFESWRELTSTLYSPEELEKIEWAIGAVISGDSKSIQKFLVFYGSAGSGKSTILNIIADLFQGYTSAFEAKALVGQNNAFATEAFKSNPLVAIQHDGDLSQIEDNTKLNSIVSHEFMTINEKYKSTYVDRILAFLFMATNKPVRITDAKSGLIRRLIDVHPTGNRISSSKYQSLLYQIEFEHGAIAKHCLNVYQKLGKNYYESYEPKDMMMRTDIFYNFILDNLDIFKNNDPISLQQAYSLYKEYYDANMGDKAYRLPRYRFRDELRNYYNDFKEELRVNDQHFRNMFVGLNMSRFEDIQTDESEPLPLALDSESSLFDAEFPDLLAQYATKDDIPSKPWSEVKTTLKDLDTRKVHYVKIPKEHIVIDFDLKNEHGDKDMELNLEAASKWPPTYAEFSKGGSGIHLHYIYDGDVTKLSRVFSDGIEIKVFTGNSSLRRRVTKCNSVAIAHISSGLPLKEEKVINSDSVKSELSLRNLIERNLRKEIHPGTKPSIDFIKKILDEAYKSDLKYDVSDMRNAVVIFASQSTNNAPYCLKQVSAMKFASEDNSEAVQNDDGPLVFFDIEIYPNLFIVVWKSEGPEKNCVRMINPKPQAIADLFKMRLVGFNNRRYDNHILYAAYMGYTVEQLYELSQKIINGGKRNPALFGEAYNISYADVYDFASNDHRMSLKKWEIELGIHHQEMEIPWDQPVDPSMWEKVCEYCENDVRATEAVFHAIREDFDARKMLAELSGLTVNDTSNMHTARIIFGDERNPPFNYTDLSTIFPGYKFSFGKSVYMDEDPSEGGYVYAVPGIYRNVGLYDIASMHPTSIEQLNLFGEYTKNFSDIKAARLAIKHRDREALARIRQGDLVKYLDNDDNLTALSYALKIAINSVYGMTSAKFPNKFNGNSVSNNPDNIVAKRGALFMITLKHECMKRGYEVVHIKTDSIKIANTNPEIEKFIMDFGKKYGYMFEHESTYDRMCLVNDAVYIAFGLEGDHAGEWTATGAQFQQPYVFKTLFSKEPIIFNDLCETKTVSSPSEIYLDFNESDQNEHNYHFVGRVGQFSPVVDGVGGGTLYRVKDGKYYALSGTKGYRWKESQELIALGRENEVDRRYYDVLVDEAVDSISKYGDIEQFIEGDLPEF